MSRAERPTCPACGAALLPDQEECRDAMDAIWEREDSSEAWAAVQSLTLHTYDLQHATGPGEIAWHLMWLCWLVEFGGHPGYRDWKELESRPILKLANYERERPSFPYPPPVERGRITVADVRGAETPGEHAARVRAWAGSVWDAWSEHHDWAREQVRRFIAQPGAAADPGHGTHSL